MDIALLNVRITFQKNEVIVDEIGNHRNVWNDVYSCYATVSGEGGSEKFSAGVLVEDSDISFTTRYCNILSNMETTKNRIIFDNEVYNIVSIDHMNFKKKSLKFKCEKVRTHGNKD
ncbi:MAG: phage head closure protein [Erysipelotrichaceae bacterium]|nr:phage head closure protein [Erysipelotrichaceae bacterium]